MNEQRDAELGARLDELGVQEHGPDYWESVMAAAGPELERLGAGAAGDEGVAAGPADQPAAESGGRRRSGGRRWLWIPAAAAVAAAAALVLLVGLPGGGSGGRLGGPAPATAAELITSVLAALDGPQGLSGHMTLSAVGHGRAVPQAEVAFVCARDGSQRVETVYAGSIGFSTADDRSGVVIWPTSPGKGDKVATAYDARARRIEEILDYGPDYDIAPIRAQDITGKPVRYVWSDYTNVAPAEPDLPLGTGPFALFRLRACLRTMLGDPRVRMTTASIDGRAVYVLRTNVINATGIFDPQEKPQPLTVVIDAATRLPLTYQWTQLRWTWEASFRIVTEKAPPSRSEFTLVMPPPAETLNGGAAYPGTQVTSRDWGFESVPLAGAAAVRAILGPVAPVFPAWMPAGFVRAAATAVDKGGLEGSPLKGRNIIVSICYRRGFDQAFLSLRVDPRRNNSSSFNGQEVQTSDPFLPEQDRRMRLEWAAHTASVRLTGGAYRGAVAHIVVDPSVWPHLWVVKGGLVATVAGDLTRAEMVRIAESLQSWNGSGGE